MIRRGPRDRRMGHLPDRVRMEDWVQEILLFANPISGLGHGKAIATFLSQGLVRASYGVRAFLDSPEKIPIDRIRSGQPAVAAIVIGGDGTLRNVAERLFQAFNALAIPPLWVFTRRAFGGDGKATAAAYLVSVAYAVSWPIASSHGSARDTPAARRNVRRSIRHRLR